MALCLMNVECSLLIFIKVMNLALLNHTSKELLSCLAEVPQSDRLSTADRNKKKASKSGLSSRSGSTLKATK